MIKLFRYLKPYALLAIISPLMMTCEVVGDLCLPYLMSYIVNFGIMGIDIHDTENGSKLASKIIRLFWGNDFTRMQLIITFGVIMLLITLIGGIFGTLCAYTAATAAQSFGNDLRRNAYKRVMSLSIEQTDRFTTGSLVTRMTNDISGVVDFAEMLMRMFVRAPMLLIGGIIMLVTLNVEFGLILLCSIPILLITLILILKKAVPQYGIIQKRLDKVNSIVQENVSGARVVKAYVREDYECKRFDDANINLRTVNYNVQKLMATIHPLLIILQNLAIIAVIYIGGLNISIAKAGMTTGSVMAAITYMTQIIFSVMMVTNMFQSISRANASAKRVNEIFDTEPVIISGLVTKADSNKLPSADIMISFKNVSFYYPGTTKRPVLNDINLDILKGETLAIIGSTGSGKTSLASLIPRFYDVSDGQVLIDNIPIKEYELTALRKKISYVMQKSELFSDTIENNIRLGLPEADKDAVVTAAKMAQADSFIEGFTEKYDTFIAEKGASLSGGQKQRISIARALVRKPEILILDDSTSALDLATETKFRNSLKELSNHTTVVMIAQRIASVMEADRIAVLENDGRIIHCAPHEELLRISDTYHDIYESQMKSGAFSTKGGKA